MLTLAEEIVLLMLDDEGGKFLYVPEHSLRAALAGAVLMELAFRGKIDADPDSLFILDTMSTEDGMLDSILKQIAAEAERHDCSYWIQYLGREAYRIQQVALQRLCDAGILRAEDKSFLWVFKSRRYPVRDDLAEKEVKQRIMALLFSDEIPDPRDIAIVGLAESCRLFERMFSRSEYERVRGRIEEIGRLELISQTISKVIREIEFQLGQATAIGPM